MIVARYELNPTKWCPFQRTTKGKGNSVGWIDVHTHLDGLKQTVEEALEQGRAAGLERFITIGTEPADHSVVLEIAKKFYPEVVCTLGVHPHNALAFDSAVEMFLRQNLLAREVVAVGEIGLDYFYSNSEPEVQKQAFRAQLNVADEMQMPVEIHTRDAEQDTVEILNEFGGRIRGMLHCFTGTQWLAEKALDLGLDISISGIVTFKKADALKEVVKFVPLERLHVETDSPFLAPVPHRGVPNTPAFMVHTAQVIADLKQVSLERLQDQAGQNARRLFPKLSWS